MTLRAAEGVDLHSHLAPGIDDGARDLDEALAAIDRLVEAGVRTILTTPHLEASLIERPSFFERNQTLVDQVWDTVVTHCRDRHPGVRLLQGRELMLDVARPRADDPRVRLNAGPYVLVEYPRLSVAAGFEAPLRHLLESGQRPVLAHIERYRFGPPIGEVVETARGLGVLLQLNAASLLGRYGPRAEALGWALLVEGRIDLAASDFHARGSPWIAEARARLDGRGGSTQGRLLFEVNPARVVSGEPLEPVPPLGGHRWTTRLRRWWRGA